MRRSKIVPLVLIGTAVFMVGCSDSGIREVKTRQHQYKSLEDCKKDWGNDEQDCRQSSGSSSYVGPRYIYNHGAGMPMAINNDGSTRQLSNTYLSRPGSTSTATTAFTQNVPVAAKSQAFSAASKAGAVVSTPSSVSRGGMGTSARATSSGG